MSNDGTRNSNGTFAKGNPGGPGRPRCPVEQDYLRRLAESISLDDWQRIVDRAKADALEGDAAARNWLAKYLLGERFAPQSLVKLYADQEEGIDEIEDEREKRRRHAADMERIERIVGFR